MASFHTARRALHPSLRRQYATGPPSRHAQWYSDILPTWGPIIVIGSGVYLALQMTRAHLAHQRWTLETRERIKSMENELQDYRVKAHLPPVAGPSEVLAATLPTLVGTSMPDERAQVVAAVPEAKPSGSWWKFWDR